MKTNLIIICILLSFSKVLNAQYIPLHLDVGTCWSYNGINTFFGAVYFNVSTTITKDTLINNLKYYKAEKKSVQMGTGNPNPPTSYYVSFLRNDTANKKVYTYEFGKDSLLYDFNLGIGDIIPRTNSIIDTTGTQVIYGVSRNFYGIKTIFYDNKPTLLFYEGIGENRANFELKIPYYDSNFNGAWAWIYATNLNGGYQSKPLFGDSLAALTCYPVSVLEVKDNLRKINVYPNPANSILSISNEQNIKLDINIMDLTGRLLLKKEIHSNNQSISLEQIASGIYILDIHYNGKHVIERVEKR